MRTLVLDIGGVFYLSRPDAAFWAHWAARAGRTAEALERAFWFGPDIELANVGRITAETYFERTAMRLELDADLVGEITVAAFRGGFNAPLAAYARDLRARGVAISSLTNNWSSAAQLMARPEFAGLFDLVISSRDVGLTKPGEAIYQLMLERLGLGADEIVFVDDSPDCVATARRLGIPTVRFQETPQAIAEIEALLR
jgi:epoxide hydrolase-like predicted phosphatase